jgi:hypothetical protein
MELKCPGRFHWSHQSLGRVIEQAPKRTPIYMIAHTIRASMRIGRHDADILKDGISHINKSGVSTKNCREAGIQMWGQEVQTWRVFVTKSKILHISTQFAKGVWAPSEGRSFGARAFRQRLRTRETTVAQAFPLDAPSPIVIWMEDRFVELGSGSRVPASKLWPQRVVELSWLRQSLPKAQCYAIA